MKFTLNVLSLSIVLAASSVQVVAEDQLPALVVSASRSDKVRVPHASSIKVITREDIELSGARSLPELLRGQPGVYVSDLFGDGSNATIDMRGFGSTANANTLIMVDGRKLNFATDTGTLYFNSIDLDNVEQVEITQGSSGILFGNMAVGGVINVITRKPVEDVIEAALDVGSYNSHKERVRFENMLGDGWSSRLVLVNKESDNYRDHNDAETKSASLRLDKVFNGGRVFAEYEYLDDYLETPGALFLDEIAQDRKQSADAYANDYQDLKHHLIRLSGDFALANNRRAEFNLGYSTDERDFISSFRYSYPGQRNTQDRQVINFNGRYFYKFKSMDFIFGVDYENTDYELITSRGYQRVDQDILGLYGQSIYHYSDNLDILAGIRYGEVWNDLDVFNTFGQDYKDELNDSFTIGMLGLSYAINNSWSVYSRIDGNYRFAKVEEYTNPVNFPQVGLDNQTGTNYEIGFSYKQKSFQSDFSIYRLELDNEISFDSSGYYNLNLDKTSRTGFSLASKWMVNDNTVIGGNYDYIDSEVTDGFWNGNSIPEISETRLTLFGEYFLDSDISLRFEGIYVGERYYGGDFQNNYEKMNSYTVFNLSGDYQFEKFSLNFRLNNLFDEHYSEIGAIGYDTVNHVSCITDGFGGYNCPSEFTAPERNLWLGLKVNL